jgi:hypothetical protein
MSLTGTEWFAFDRDSRKRDAKFNEAFTGIIFLLPFICAFVEFHPPIHADKTK